AGTEALFQGWAQGRCGIKSLTRFSATRYQTALAGEVSRQDVLPHPVWLAGLLETVLQEALAQARTRGVRPHDLRTAPVVVGTTKAWLGPLEAQVRSGGQNSGPASSWESLLADLLLRFDLQGPVRVVSLACASGALALAQAAESLATGRHPAVVAVGVDELSDFVLTGFSSLKSLDPGPCRPFDAQRRGLSLGEGAAAVVLTQAKEVAQPLGYLSGWGFANDATHLTAPNREGIGLTSACVRALSSAACLPGSVHYINAHGTGTVYNDAMEAKAVAKVFGLPGPPVSTLKGNTGHTLGAGSVLEAVATWEALRRRLAPPTCGLETPGVDERLDFIVGAPRPLPAQARALSMSAGFGGFNAALVLEAGEA
ncbi:MAG: beta-ketoacyl-[acyl-carrier-protein] synthase family protein, partial [Candidatus Firestonebacteria bacterium]|nr:beta-ketoacyl-[acyl-carrier-protein] synthase family protein [Candidatus Firestonebacteria bacterium]